MNAPIFTPAEEPMLANADTESIANANLTLTLKALTTLIKNTPTTGINKWAAIYKTYKKLMMY